MLDNLFYALWKVSKILGNQWFFWREPVMKGKLRKALCKMLIKVTIVTSYVCNRVVTMCSMQFSLVHKLYNELTWRNHVYGRKCREILDACD